MTWIKIFIFLQIGLLSNFLFAQSSDQSSDRREIKVEKHNGFCITDIAEEFAKGEDASITGRLSYHQDENFYGVPKFEKFSTFFFDFLFTGYIGCIVPFVSEITFPNAEFQTMQAISLTYIGTDTLCGDSIVATFIPLSSNYILSDSVKPSMQEWVIDQLRTYPWKQLRLESVGGLKTEFFPKDPSQSFFSNGFFMIGIKAVEDNWSN